MIINLFTRTHNNESLIKDFVDFYKSRVSNIRINIHDMASTDKTVELAKELGCNVRNYSDFFTTKDNWKNGCWKNIPSDTIVICDIDEFIDLTPVIFQNCSLVTTKGFDIEDLNNLTEEKRNTDYDKICIFDPHTIKDMHFERVNCNPQGFIRIGEVQPNLYHLTKFK